VEFWKDPGQTVSLQEFWRVASSALETVIVEARDDRADAVHVMSVYEARQWDVSSLFVCGLTDRDFPKRHPQNLLFPDSDIDRLRAGGIPLRKASDQEVEERGLFQCLLSRATGTLFLTHPQRDATGKTVQPSRFLLDLNADAEQARECRPVPAVAAYDRGQAGHVSAKDLQTEMARLHQIISLTSLEDLAQCRFKFFGGRTLGLKEPPERPEKRLRPRVSGSILHETLERWLGDKEQDFVELFEAAFDETCRKQHLPAGYRLEVERIQLRDIARRVSANELWKADSSAAEVELVLQFPGGIAVNCRIDRLDTFGDDCVIVDYKSGRTASVEKLVESNTRLQGPLYALAARERLNLNPVAMVYWAVREDERYGWGKIPGTDLAYTPMPENWTSDARTRTIDRLASFLQGEVHAHPEEAELCRWCEFVGACRIEQQEFVMIAEKAQGA
jgi:ATP-dependent helicase/DNAse subunit B